MPTLGVNLQSLSSPEKMVSGEDTVVQVSMADGSPATGMVLRLNGADVSDQLKPSGNGNALLALLTGLKQGENTVEVSDAGTGALRSSLTLTAYPIQGPVLYAPQEETFYCQSHQFTIYPGGPTLSAAPIATQDCAVDTRVDWVYHDKTKSGTAVWQKYDPANPPDHVETTTVQGGAQVPYIVRLETGVINRGIYQIAVIDDPANNPTTPSRLAPPAAFNGKLIYPFGQSCGGGWYRQGTAMGPMGGSEGDTNALQDLALRQGFAVANNTLNYFGQNCNHIISAETAMMVKERVVKAYGPLLYTMGWGGSGSAMQQSMIADVYPGLLDGIVMMYGFPDNTNPASVDGRLFYNYQLNHTKEGTTQNGLIAAGMANPALFPNGAYDSTYDNATAAKRAADPTLASWTNSQLAAASGYSTYHSIRQQASYWAGRTDSVSRPINQGDRDNIMAGAANSSVNNAIVPAAARYSPSYGVSSAAPGATFGAIAPAAAPAVSTLAPNPKGLRPNVSDHNKNTLGVDGNGFGRSYTANEGIQYGLNALNTGQITMAQFIDLNRKIGGQDIDGNLSTARMVADREGLKNAYQTGMIMWGGAGLQQTAILDMDARDVEYTGSGDLHLKFFHYMIRARIAAANKNGSHGNHVMWNGVGGRTAFVQDANANHDTPVQLPRSAIASRIGFVYPFALEQMDTWLTAVANDNSTASRPEKLIKHKPARMTDGCFGNTTLGADDDFVAEKQVFGGYNTVFANGNGAADPHGIVGKSTLSTCNAKFPASSFPRFDAGAPITDRAMQCAFKPVSASDYAGYAALNPGWSGAAQAADLSTLSNVVFPKGVCDYTKPGLEEQPLAGTWIQITGLNERKIGHALPTR